MAKLIRVKGGPQIIPFCKRIRKKLGNDTGRYGLFHYGKYEYGAQNEIGFDLHGVYQMRYCKEGYIPVKMRFQKTREEVATGPRQANWDKFAAAILAWKSLTQEEKEAYNKRAYRKTLYGCNLFIREYMLSH